MRARFGDFEVDSTTVEIRRAGELVEVQPQVFAVIEYLIEHRDRVVPKEELLDNIWGDRFVGESALTTRIKSARQALGDDGRSQGVIKTVHGRGYRFVADAAVEDDRDAAGSRPDAAASSPEPSIATGWPTELPPADPVWPFVGRFAQLAGVELLYREQRVAGVSVRGGPRVGKSRFGAECLRRLADSAVPTLPIRGLASTRSIPLSALAGWLPDDIVRSDHTAEDLARADIYRRSYETFVQLLSAGPSRPALLVDDAHLLDSMSAALVASALADGHAFGVVVQASTDADDGNPFGELISTDRLQTIELAPLTEVDVDILLYRALGGPIDPVSLAQLIESSGRVAGTLRDIVEASRRCGSFVERDGVWQLTGPPTSSRATSWPPDDLDPAAVDGAERLALLGPVRFDIAARAVAETALEELEERLLLQTTDDGGDGVPVVALADPVLAATVADGIAPLKARRLKANLAPILLEFDDPAALARLIEWGVDADGATGLDDEADEPQGLDPDRVIGAAFTALLNDDLVVADNLAASVDPALHPAAAVVLGEVALKRGQWERAVSVLSAVDEDQVDPFLASLAIRRVATIGYTHHGRHQEAIEHLTAEAQRQEGSIARAILARRLSLLTLSGRYLDVLDQADDLDDSHGVTQLEVLVSTAGAELGVGRMEAALRRCRMAWLLLDEVVPKPWRTESQDAIASTECSAHLQAGELDRAIEVIRSHLQFGVRSALGILATKAAETELEAGRPRAARTILESTLDGSSRNEFPQFIGLADVLTSRIDLELGHREAALAGIDKADAALDGAPPVMRWRIAVWLGELLAADDRTGEAIELQLRLADQAAAAGAPEAEVDLLCGAAAIDPEPTTAAAVLDRLAKAGGFEGRLWPVRIDHIRARAAADRSALATVADRYRELGYLRLARLADAAERS
jgi:DNA-binding winged helix-turn-helix (wHTH) protein/predicted negative regulator of RcsB-dependent stress response